MSFIYFPKDFDTAIERGSIESIRFFNSWKNYVINTVPEDRLLIFEARQGWKPLCDFLELPIPNTNFPNV